VATIAAQLLHATGKARREVAGRSRLLQGLEGCLPGGGGSVRRSASFPHCVDLFRIEGAAVSSPRRSTPAGSSGRALVAANPHSIRCERPPSVPSVPSRTHGHNGRRGCRRPARSSFTSSCRRRSPGSRRR
jgi:hypothetical protein